MGGNEPYIIEKNGLKEAVCGHSMPKFEQGAFRTRKGWVPKRIDFFGRGELSGRCGTGISKVL